MIWGLVYLCVFLFTLGTVLGGRTFRGYDASFMLSVVTASLWPLYWVYCVVEASKVED